MTTTKKFQPFIPVLRRSQNLGKGNPRSHLLLPCPTNSNSHHLGFATDGFKSA
ncbi:hypothetical protein [Coleofasciculus sp. E2-BRE-01]|uniref:hypothetical protein n=1 Tax=Coleofasciculus sp. E2-BRE-01 TaxID=3069524 RepID=UPI0040649100